MFTTPPLNHQIYTTIHDIHVLWSNRCSRAWYMAKTGANAVRFPNISATDSSAKKPVKTASSTLSGHRKPQIHQRYIQNGYQAVDVPVIFDGNTSSLQGENSSLYGTLFKRDQNLPSPVHWREFVDADQGSTSSDVANRTDINYESQSVVFVGKDGARVTDPAGVDLQVTNFELTFVILAIVAFVGKALTNHGFHSCWPIG